MLTEKWIWLPKKIYPKFQTSDYSSFHHEEENYFVIAEFCKKYSFDKKIASAKLRFSGDTDFQLYCNEELVGTGPACVGGDFLGNEKPRPDFYSYEEVIYPEGKEMNFYARVRMLPVLLCDYSKGHGGFMMAAQVLFEDGTDTVITTDETWDVRMDRRYFCPDCYDGSLRVDPYVKAEVIDNIWNTVTAQIPVRVEEEVFPEDKGILTFKPHELKEVTLEFDKIYAGYLCAKVTGKGSVNAIVYCRELEEEGIDEELVLCGNDSYRGFRLESVGKFYVNAENDSDEPAVMQLSLITTHYPVTTEAKTVTADEDLNLVLDVCRHTLKYCRQTHHLDSPRHCEPLACSGDYYIESLMTAFSFGDMRLAEFDLLRTASLLRNNDGRLFHTSYSLIWVKWLYDVYMFTGNKELLEKCEDALNMLLHRFTTYIGENGLIETPPDYMFIDWIYIDGITLHHPPKALGQTCLNMFYFGALEAAAAIYKELGKEEKASDCLEKREHLRESINTLLYDKERGLYFEGLNTKTPDEMLNYYLSQNVEKRYYLKHSNILAACFGVCEKETAVQLIDKIMSDECPGNYQPYFAHFLMEAIYNNGLRDKYTLQLLEKWKAPIKECPKGLIEGFITPEPTYYFDRSHAWGGTPLYSLPKALTGMTIKKPGMKEVSFDPSLLGLKYARVEIPVSDGMYVCELKENEEPTIIFQQN